MHFSDKWTKWTTRTTFEHNFISYSDGSKSNLDVSDFLNENRPSKKSEDDYF